MEFSTNTLLLCAIFGLSAVASVVMLRRRKALQNVMEERIQMFKKAFDISEDAVVVLSEENKLLYMNQAFGKLFDLPKEYEKDTLDPMPSVRVKKEWIPLDRFVREQAESPYNEAKMRSFPQSSLMFPDHGEQRIPVNLYIERARYCEEEESWCYIVVIHDMRKEFERSKVAYRHKLTNLPNHLQAKEDLNKLFSKIHLHNKKLALILIDIDNFSQIRAITGYQQSENILIRFAQYLENMAKESSFYAYHTYSNHFLLCLPVIETVDEAVYFCRQIQKKLVTFYKINDVPFHLTASMGVSIYPDSGSTINLLDRAYKALAEAQKIGFGHIHIYRQTEMEKQYDELELFNAIHEAIAKKEFEVYYQPIVRAKDREVVAAEALIRWKHSEYGFIPPPVFIPMLEKSGFIIELGRFVLSEVLKQQKRWEMFKFKPIEVSINMSVLEIEAEGFVENVERELQTHQVAPELIKFEITEGAAMENETVADRQLQALKDLGVPISLDDFGTGYTSFSYLKQFPADVLKIDKTLVDYILENEEDQRIVKAMIDLGHTLGMKIVVEGIENEEMADMLRDLGSDYLQGYYFAKPLPAYEFQELIRR